MLLAKYKRKMKVLITIVILVGLLLPLGQPYQLIQPAHAEISDTIYFPGTRDTKKPPEAISYDITEPSGYEELYRTDNLIYYYREDRDIIAVYDRSSGYTWKTGLDLEFNSVIDKASNEAAKDKKLEASIPKEDKLNTIYTGFANSLLTVEYFDASKNITMVSSASINVESKLATVNGDPAHRRLDVYFSSIDLTVALHVYLGEDGITYEIKKDEVSGDGLTYLSAFIISPFLGASGGQKVHYNPETDAYDIKVPNPIIPGYVLIPDGSGALIRFGDNTMPLKAYTGSVYGEDLGQSQFYYSGDSGMIPRKEPLMPVFGIAHGDRQAAFVAYARQGAEYMEIEVSPEENMTYYTFAYPRFVVNRLYHQVYNKKGDGYFSLFKDPNAFDISMTYTFLHGDGSDGSPAADYTGMARIYREYLLESESLKIRDYTYDTTPIRLDFIMSDIKKGVLGYNNVITTTAADVKEILNDVNSTGITNINVGLYGYQKGGITGGKPWNANFNRNIGSSADFKQLISGIKDSGVDISFAQDYSRINTIQMNLKRNWTIHVNGWGLKRSIAQPGVQPVSEINFANSEKSVEWLLKQTSKLSRLEIDSVTIEGMSEILLSHYGSKPMSRQESAETISKAFEKTAEKYLINASAPNSYLWKYVGRFLKTPVFPTQYIIETDTVPFLQLVLHGTMEMYAPYSNFSFYTPQDVLRMIDYNVSPSFVLTKEPSYNLSSTNSSGFYSTEYSLYASIIEKVYNKVNGALSNTIGREWIGRSVIDDGVIVNSYSDGLEVLINYTSKSVEYEGITTGPEDYGLIWK